MPTYNEGKSAGSPTITSNSTTPLTNNSYSQTPVRSTSDEHLRQRSRSSNARYPKNRHDYPKKGSFDYKGSLSSEEARRRRYELEQKRKEELQKNQGFSPLCYLISLFISAVVATSLIYVTIYVYTIPYPDDIVISHKTYAHETYRRSVTILSDNLDCTLYMKRQIMQKEDLREVALSGLRCLFINEPHSVAPDSGISMLYYFRQDREAAAHNLERYNKLNNVSNCKLGSKGNNKCQKHLFVNLHTSKVDLSARNFMHKGFNTEWIQEDSTYKERYGLIFEKFARFKDFGDDNIYREATTISKYQLQGAEVHSRIFRVSDFLEKSITALNEEKNRTIYFCSNYSSIFKINNYSRKKDKIVVTRTLARIAVNEFLYQTKSREELNYYSPRIRLRGVNGRLALIPYILYPNGSTHSIFAAFIVKTVFDYYQHIREERKSFSEANVLATILKAQRLAYHFFVFSKEWSGEPNGISMMARTNVATEMLARNHSLLENLLLPKRRVVDRSSSLIIWQHGSQEEVHVVGAALPKLFDSKHIHCNDRSDFSRFSVEINGTKYESLPLTSHSSLVVTEELNQEAETNHPQYIASCSGSVRNVEAVATSILMQMLFNHSPGKAAWSSSIFVDIRDGKTYCDYEASAKIQKNKQKVQEFYKEVEQEAGFNCNRIKDNDFWAHDKILMLASRPGIFGNETIRKSIINPNQYITSAIDNGVSTDYNYAAGY